MECGILLFVHPDYQGKGIAGNMIEHIKEKYRNVFYIEEMPEDKANMPFFVGVIFFHKRENAFDMFGRTGN